MGGKGLSRHIEKGKYWPCWMSINNFTTLIFLGSKIQQPCPARKNREHSELLILLKKSGTEKSKEGRAHMGASNTPISCKKKQRRQPPHQKRSFYHYLLIPINREQYTHLTFQDHISMHHSLMIIFYTCNSRVNLWKLCVNWTRNI